jgi:hypothetical protein
MGSYTFRGKRLDDLFSTKGCAILLGQQVDAKLENLKR